MKKTFIYIILIISLFIGINSVSAKDKYRVTLNKCVDGDTSYFNLKDEVLKTRFLAINTPESTKTVEEYGKEASKFTCDILSSSKKIEIEYDKNSDKKDKYGRDLVWVWVDGKLLQEELLENGLAEVKYLYGDYKYTDHLLKVEQKAKEDRLNMWSDKEDSNDDYFYYILGIILLIVLMFTKKGRKEINKEIVKIAKRRK